MAPRLLILAGLCILRLAAAAQPGNTRSAELLSTLRPMVIRLDNYSEPALPVSLTFDHFQVIDLRPDTSRIGVHGNLPMRSHSFDRQLSFRRPAELEIGAFLNRHFDRKAGADTAVIILRDLWLSDTDPFGDEEAPATPDAWNGRPGTHIRLRAEVYLRRNARYLPLVRIDTLQQTKFVTYSILRSTYLGWERDLAALFRELTQKAAAAAALRPATGKWIAWEDIRRFNERRFDIPIFDSSTLRRGVYADFEEFRNNSPSIHDFEVLPENGNLALYLRNNDGSTYYTRNVWGFCDGQRVFVMRNGLLHLLRKDGNSFFFYGVDVPAADLMTMPLAALNPTTEQHCLYIVDMDTGKFY